MKKYSFIKKTIKKNKLPFIEMQVNGDMLLEKILEEDSIYGDDRARDNLSPISNDKKYLLGNGHNNHMSTHITRI